MFDKARSDELLKMKKTEEVVEELVKLHGGLMGKQLKKFGLIGDPDAISFAYEALYIAILTYKHTNEFSTYATICIYNKLGDYVRRLNTCINQNTVSYEGYLADNLTFLDTIPSDSTVDGELLTEDSIDTIMLLIGKCISCMRNPTHKKILRLWMESDFTLQQTEIAEQLGISQSYVSQAINMFRKNLKSKLEVER